MAIVSRYTVALHILTLLGLITEGNDTFVPSDRIAASVNTNPVFIRRVLGTLRKAGLVSVQRGGTGAGWRLARHPGEITLLDVYRAIVQTPLFELHHSTPNQRCVIGRGIQSALKDIYENSETAMKRELAQVTVADLLRETVARKGRNS
ncbi:MAG TPA: Rrf2 family transcriptional regulator [Longimicrobiales bacterium]